MSSFGVLWRKLSQLLWLHEPHLLFPPDERGVTSANGSENAVLTNVFVNPDQSRSKPAAAEDCTMEAL